MKKTTFLALCLTALVSLTASAKIWRVNNNPTIPADFTTIQAAHDGAMANDTIHIEPSGISYGNLTMTKKLIIIGNGYFLNENANNQLNPNSSIVNNILMRNGCSGSKIMGLVIDNIDFQNSDGLGLHITDDIIIERDYFTGFNNNSFHLNESITFETTASIAGHLSNLIIRNNYITGSIKQTSIIGGQGYYNINNLLISNNYIKQGLELTDPANSNCYNSGIIANNVFGEVVNYNSRQIFGCGLLVKNNIFNNTYNSAVYGNLNTVSNNITQNASGLLTGNGNQNGVDMTTVFKGISGNTTDSQWQLKAGSPAIGAGQSGEDCGMFGGTNPYKLSGLPAVPSIYGLSAPLNSNGNTLPVVISTKSNN